MALTDFSSGAIPDAGQGNMTEDNASILIHVAICPALSRFIT